jgi:hypothetical protein
MKNNDELVDNFWAKLRRADLDQTGLEYGLETRVMARLREIRRPGSLSLLQLAGRFCLASLCALLLLSLYLPSTVNAIEFSGLVEAVTSDDSSSVAGLLIGDTQ